MAYDEMNGADDLSEAPLGQDLHRAISEVREIDAQILKLRKVKEIALGRIEKGLNEVQRHYSDVTNPSETVEAPGPYDEHSIARRY